MTYVYIVHDSVLSFLNFWEVTNENYSLLLFYICQFSFWYRRIDVILLKFAILQTTEG